MTTLPTDAQVQNLLAPVRFAVLEATHTVRSPRRSTRYRTTRNLIIAGAAVAALTAGAIVALQSQGYIDTTATCYEHASLDSRTWPVNGVGPGVGKLDPISGCTQMWREGAFGNVPVPPLVACTLQDGSAAVFPREDGPAGDTDFCAALGLADWDSD